MTILIKGTAALGLALVLAACNQNQTETSTPAPEASSPDSAAPITTAQEKKFKRYRMKSGRIEYTVSGMQTGPEVMTWDDFGIRQVTDTKTKLAVAGMTVEQDQRAIESPESIITIDNKTKTATRIKNPMQDVMSSADAKDMEDLGEKMMERMGAERKGKDQVLGKTCDNWVIEQFNTTACIWNGLTLKTETNMMGMSMKKVATKIEENVSVDGTMFKVPEGMTVQDAPSGMMPGMAAMPGAQGGAKGGQMPKMPEGMKLPEGVKLPAGMMPPAASGAE